MLHFGNGTTKETLVILRSIVSMQTCSAYKSLLSKYQLKILKEKFYSLLPTNLVSQIITKEKESYLEEHNEGESSTPWMEVILQYGEVIR